MDSSDHSDSQWSDLPSNVLLRVFGCLNLHELCTAGRVCRAWHGVVGSDSLWSSLLQQHYGISTPLGSSNSCRHTLLQLRTSSIWATGNFKADTTCVTPGLLVPPSAVIPLSVSGTEFVELWSAQQARSFNNSSPSSGSPAAAAFFEHKCQLPQGFAASAIAAGGNHLVLLGSSGSVVDTRGAFVKESQPGALQKQDAATKLLAWLLQQQGRTDPSTDADQHWEAVVGRLREGHNISMRNPWLPTTGAVITSIASGDGHVLAAATDGRVWGWGRNEAGQLGLGSCSAWQSTPVDITAVLDGAWKAEGECVVQAACGTSHSVLLMDTGAVYTAGCNSSGQCGQDLAVNECTVFCQPLVASAPPTLMSAGNSSPGPSARQQRLRSARNADSPTPSTLPDTAEVPEMPATGSAGPSLARETQAALLPPATTIAAGPSNTLVATRFGRMFVCGASSSGQCGPVWVKAAVCPGFIDIGPEVGWHGLTRPSAAEVEAAGGQVADALAKVVQVAAGDGSCYALTDAGEVFAWGQGSKGQLGTGGCPKVQSTPAKLPWARQIRHISASPTGQFATAVDTAGKLYTWGAGKWGQLGHGDTSKRTVGRLVKQLRHLDVLQVCCCAESMMVLTAQHIPCMQQPRRNSERTDLHTSQHNSTQQAPDTPPAGQLQKQLQAKSKQQKGSGRGSRQVQLSSDVVQPFPASPSTSPPSRSGSSSKHSNKSRQQERAGPTSTAPAGCEDSCVGAEQDSALEQLLGDMSMRGVDWQDIKEQGPFFCPAPKPNRQFSRRQRSTEDPDYPCSQSPSSRSSSHLRRAGSSSSASTGGGSNSSPRSRQPRMDKGFKRLLKRLLTSFMADSSQREMTFPASLSASDRYHVHVAAEAWGLAHASHNEDDDRVIKVWKVSRTRKSPVYSDCDYGSD